jgi:peroxiredoxin
MRFKATALVVAAAAALVVAACSGAEPDREQAKSESRCGANAPAANLAFTLEDLEGRNVRLSDYKGKVLLLDFWATWCGPCRIEIPWFVEMYDKYKARGLEVAGVVVLDQFSNAGPFARRFKMNYPVLNGDGRDDLEAAFGPLFALPTTFIIGRDGRVCERHVGLTARETFEAAIRRLL